MSGDRATDLQRADVTLAPCQAADAPALAELRLSAMRESLEQAGVFDADRARERLLLTFDARHTRHICADGQRVGFVVVRPSPYGHLLDQLCVLPQHQRRGIGSITLGIVQDEIDRLGRSLVVCALRGSASNRFYVRHGFVLLETSGVDNYYVRPARPDGPAGG